MLWTMIQCKGEQVQYISDQRDEVLHIRNENHYVTCPDDKTWVQVTPHTAERIVTHWDGECSMCHAKLVVLNS